MGLLRAAIVFVLGNFFITMLDGFSNKANNIPLLNEKQKKNVSKYIKNNKASVLLILISLSILII